MRARSNSLWLSVVNKISDRQIDADIVMMDDRHKRKDEQTR